MVPRMSSNHSVSQAGPEPEIFLLHSTWSLGLQACTAGPTWQVLPKVTQCVPVRPACMLLDACPTNLTGENHALYFKPIQLQMASEAIGLRGTPTYATFLNQYNK